MGALIRERERERVKQAWSGKRSQEAQGLTRSKWRYVTRLPVSIATSRNRKGVGWESFPLFCAERVSLCFFSSNTDRWGLIRTHPLVCMSAHTFAFCD